VGKILIPTIFPTNSGTTGILACGVFHLTLIVSLIVATWHLILPCI